MGKSHPPHNQPIGRPNFASCIVAAIFLIFLLIIPFALYFTIFKPKDPKLSVNAVQLPAFSIANSTINFTFSQYVTVNNPNRAVFTTTTARSSSSTPGTKSDSCSYPQERSVPERPSTWRPHSQLSPSPCRFPASPRARGPPLQMGLAGSASDRAWRSSPDWRWWVGFGFYISSRTMWRRRRTVGWPSPWVMDLFWAFTVS
ncbi:UNVERIFIED_CONTAM: hypothetical protein Scaly_2386000 [Sesamum calycinum]|uniref:Late embryogenesis abundant protein LEA-2 subgroup domain-containing protein n=1 Tax=Sesamum calycinum TaxID=2727403 RepID=A0AAW2M088_9LAMI